MPSFLNQIGITEIDLFLPSSFCGWVEKSNFHGFFVALCNLQWIAFWVFFFFNWVGTGEEGEYWFIHEYVFAYFFLFP